MVGRKETTYEEFRRKRLEENKKRMEELNLHILAQSLRTTATTPMKKIKPRTPRQPLDLSAVRRSSRVADKPPPSYREGKSAIVTERALEVQANLLHELPSFAKPVFPSHVSGNFWLGFPKKFCDLHLPKHDDTVVLVNESEQEFETKYCADRNGLSGGLSGGWGGFSIAHKLLEKDVLVFQLIAPCKFKVYIVRANALTEIDGAIGLLNLDSCVKAMDIEKDMKISAMSREKHLEPHFLDNDEDHNHQENGMIVLNNDLEAAADQSGSDSDDYGTEDFEVIRFSQSIVDFKDVKGIENFNIHVDGLIIDSEIPSHLRIKYYELCCSQNLYLHEQLLKGLNLKLTAVIISETINIADAIRSCNLTTSRDNLKVWDNTLKAFEDLGMKVGFLRGRINKLVTLSSGSEEVVKCKRLELVKAVEEMRVLEIKLSDVKDVIKDLDGEIEVLKMKGEKLEVVFKEEAKAPW